MSLSEILITINWYTGFAAVAVLTLNVIIGSTHYRNLELPIRRLLYFLIWNLIIEISSRSLAYAGIQNLPLLHLYTLGEFILLSLFYKSIIDKPISYLKWYVVLLISGCLMIVTNSVFFQDIYGFNTFAKTGVQVFVISMAVLYFYNLSENAPSSLLSRKALRLINSAILIYYSGSMFVFMFSQFSFENNTELYTAFWIFNAILNLVFQLLILWALSKVVFKKIASSS